MKVHPPTLTRTRRKIKKKTHVTTRKCRTIVTYDVTSFLKTLNQV